MAKQLAPLVYLLCRRDRCEKQPKFLGFFPLLTLGRSHLRIIHKLVTRSNVCTTLV